MRRRITRFEIGQTTKMMVGLYAVFGLIAGLFVFLFSSAVPGLPRMGFLAIIILPICYAIAGLIIVPIACVLYNFVAKYLGGIEINSEDSTPG